MTKKLLKLSLDDVQALSKGQRSKSKSGSRRIPHRLTKEERVKFEVAKKRGYLKIPLNAPRQNLINVYRLWCEVTGREFVLNDSSAR
jgi:hypothetical protein